MNVLVCSSLRKKPGLGFKKYIHFRHDAIRFCSVSLTLIFILRYGASKYVAFAGVLFSGCAVVRGRLTSVLILCFRCLTPDWVLCQLKYRYDREIDNSNR